MVMCGEEICREMCVQVFSERRSCVAFQYTLSTVYKETARNVSQVLFYFKLVLAEVDICFDNCTMMFGELRRNNHGTEE
jgi:hypothetical protein